MSGAELMPALLWAQMSRAELTPVLTLRARSRQVLMKLVLMKLVLMKLELMKLAPTLAQCQS